MEMEEGGGGIQRLPEGCVSHVLSLTSPRDVCRSVAVSWTFRFAAIKLGPPSRQRQSPDHQPTSTAVTSQRRRTSQQRRPTDLRSVGRKRERSSPRWARMQGGSTGIVYGGLKYQARCIADVKADAGHTSFLAGTHSLREENEVHLIRLSPSGAELVCEGLFYHPSEIWDLASCPYDQRVFSTVFASGETYGAVIWKIPELYGQSNSPQLEQLVSLDGHSFKIKSVLWWPSGKHDNMISIDEQNLFLWTLDSSSKIAKVQSQESVGMLHSLSGGTWDPHDRNAIAAFGDSFVQCWDLRTMKKTSSIEHSHVRDADYNPNKQHILATAEDEAGIRLWDLRMPNIPFRELPGHAHWTWAVQHNPQYDQLILSAGTDSTVNLWLASSSGSDDSMSESHVDSPTRQTDPLLNSYTDYEDSVYGIAWSSREPSLFASLSYDGTVVVESVKSYLPRK